MLKSVRSRLIASYLVVVLLAMAIAVAISLPVLDRAFLDVLRQNLLAQALRVAQTVESEMPSVAVTQEADSDGEQGEDADPGANSYYAIATDQDGMLVYEFKGGWYYVTGPYTDSLTSPALGYDAVSNLVAGYHTRLVDMEGKVFLEMKGDVTLLPSAQLDPLETEYGAYTQAANVLPGYHSHVIDEQSVVILDPAAEHWLQALFANPTPSRRVWTDSGYDAETAGQYEDLQSNLGFPPNSAAQPEAAADALLGRPEVQSAFAGEPATQLRTYPWAPTRRVLYAAYPVRAADGSVVSVAYIASPLPRFSLSLLPEYLGPQALGGAAVAVLIAGVAGFFLARTLTRPLQRLKEAASALARGEEAAEIPHASTDELDSLGVAFNTMNASLAAAHGALAAYAQQREAILQGLADAVLATNTDGEVILANPAAADLLRNAPQPLREAIKETLERGEPTSSEVTVRERVIELLTTPLRGEDGPVTGVVAVGHDVTAYRQLDRLRTSFVGDVSHELRTPLTAIKGFVETLQEGAADDPEARRRFLQTVATETDRLIRLTNDLLLLTRADADQLELRLSTTSLAACVDRAVAQLQSCAQGKQISIVVEQPDEAPLVRVDRDRIHQVLVNLLDNAVKFTPPEGRVALAFGREDGLVSCTVSDTGPGIPADEIPHLFGRFYRGDSSRARQGAGGYGLGLAIAKAIVEAHGGRLWVESEPGEGASFTLALPAAA
jgi:signal transduction histidine kinase